MTKPKSIQQKNALVFTALVALVILLNPLNVVSQTGGNGAAPATLPQNTAKELQFKRRSTFEFLEKTEKRLKEFQVQRKEEEKRFAELSKKREATLKKDNGNAVSTESYTAIIQTLQSQRVSLLVDLAGMEARERAIRNIRSEMESEGTEIIDQLEQLVKIQQSNLDAISQRVKVAAASKAELNSAKSKLLEVEIRLAEAKQKSKTPTYLNDFYVKSSLDQAEKKARLEMTESLLSSFAQSRKELQQQISIQGQYTNSKMQLDMIERNIKSYQDRIARLKEEISEFDSLLNVDQDKN